MTCLGRFHAESHSKKDEYHERLRSVNPRASREIPEDWEQETLVTLRALNVPYTTALQAEMRMAMQETLNPTGPFATVIHSDPCPDNVFDFPDRLLLIDFEFASVMSCLLDATYPRMSFPSGWCAKRIPEELIDAVEASYRNELKKRIPAARDDRTYYEAYTQACAHHMLTKDMGLIPHILEEDSIRGISSQRSRVISHLQAFIAISEKHQTLPALRSMAVQILHSLEDRWPNAKPLHLYPAFSGRISPISWKSMTFGALPRNPMLDDSHIVRSPITWHEMRFLTEANKNKKSQI
ncbi:MAG: phosphotransferase [Chlamydiae bacterium]|nr:phosphotransferase [Chlamydiota bacterium]